MRPAVSVGFGYTGALALDSDIGLPQLIPPHPSVDDKPVVMDNLFDFDQFPEVPSSSFMDGQPTHGMADSHVDFFGASLFPGHSPTSVVSPFGFPDGFDAKFSDLQSASGATFVSDEALAAEL